jgi:TPR repeat protein
MKIKHLLLLLLTCFLASQAYAQTTDFNKGMAAFKAKDFKNTILQLTPFAKKGNCAAQYAVGYSYTHDFDIKNDSLAISWLLLAAEQKNTKAMAALADCYFWDTKAVDHLVRSYLWGMLGATYDPAQRINTITLLAKAYMKPEELDRANKFINEYELRWFSKPNCQ